MSLHRTFPPIKSSITLPEHVVFTGRVDQQDIIKWWLEYVPGEVEKKRSGLHEQTANCKQKTGHRNSDGRVTADGNSLPAGGASLVVGRGRALGRAGESVRAKYIIAYLQTVHSTQVSRSRRFCGVIQSDWLTLLSQFY